MTSDSDRRTIEKKKGKKIDFPKIYSCFERTTKRKNIFNFDMFVCTELVSLICPVQPLFLLCFVRFQPLVLYNLEAYTRYEFFRIFQDLFEDHHEDL